MSTITKPILLDETGQSINESLVAIKKAIENTETVLQGKEELQAETERLLTTIPEDYTALTEEVSKLSSDIVEITNNERITNWNDGYLITNGTVVDVSNVTKVGTWKHAIIECVEGDKFTISGSSAAQSRLWCFTDENYNTLSMDIASAIRVDIIISAPVGTKYLILNNNDNYAKSYFGVKISHKTDRLNNVIDCFKENLTFSLTPQTYIGYSTGIVGENYNKAYSSDFLKIYPNAQVNLVNVSDLDLSKNCGLAFYGKQQEYISGISYGASESNVCVIAPQNAEYFRFTVYYTKVNDFDIIIDSRSKLINEYYKENILLSGYEPINEWKEGYLSTNGTVVDVSNVTKVGTWKHTIIDCVEGDKFKVIGYGTSPARLWCFTDENYNVIDSAIGTVSTDELILRTPIGAKYLILNDSSSYIAFRISNDKKIFNDNYNIIGMYDKSIHIGDSLTYGQVYTSSSKSRQAFNPYPKVFGKLCGLETLSFARSGASAKSWWKEFGENSFNENGLYIVFLGTNGGLSNTIDSDCIGTDISHYADTNTGYYGRILQTIFNNGNKAILIKPYQTDALEETNATIDAFSKKYQFPAISIDSSDRVNPMLHKYPDSSGGNSLHFNDFGYAWLANKIIEQINNLSDVDKFYIMRTQ